ncbi:hypothetical protein ACHAWT_010699 [Skeletonema menzelii]
MQLFGHIGKRSRHSAIICSPLSTSYARCWKKSYNHRCNSGSSSNNSNNTNSIATGTEETITRRRRRRRKKQSFSPLLQITSNHPKSTNPHHYNTTTPSTNEIKLLTRKQLLRLTPKQRSNLYRHRLQQHKDSMSYLQQARTNVRSNLNYLGDTAGSNFKKNIKVIQRLFRGEEEEIWKDEIVEGTKQQQQQRSKQLKSQQEKDELDWERLPSEIKQNVQSNLVTVQNWLHKATDGMIPSPSLVHTDGTTTSSSSIIGGSVATRVQEFHQAKQSRGLVMDRKWFAWNIALALLPGALIGLYLNYMQDEMKEYYIKLEEQERARILGPSAVVVDGNEGKESQQEEQNRNKEQKGMGISSAFVLEGGGVFEKVKMAVNDLFLGGVEERIGKVRDVEDDTTESHQQEEKEQSTTSASVPVHEEDASGNQTLSESETALDPAMKLLLQRIESLEKQLGIDNGQQQQQHQRENIDKYAKERPSRQSPLQSRRDASLASKWTKEEEVKSRVEADAVLTKTDDASDSNDESNMTLWKFAQGIKSLVDNDVNSVRDMLLQSGGDASLAAGDSQSTDGGSTTISAGDGPNQGGAEDGLVTKNEEEVNESDTLVESIAEEVVNIDNAPEKASVPMEEVISSTTAVENIPDERIEDEQVAKDVLQAKGFRAWISRLLFRKQNRGQAENEE